MKRLILTLLAALAVAFAGASPALATAPPSHKVTICHATPPDTAENGWVAINVDIASTGYQHSGHQDQHDADIIPAYDYPGFVFAGKNLDTYFYGVLGSDILANGCVDPTQPTPSPVPSSSIPPCDECGGPVESLPNTAAELTSTSTGSSFPWVIAFLGVLAGSLIVLSPRKVGGR